MPRPKHIDRPRRVDLHIPQSVYSLLERELFSNLEGRVPHGEISRLITNLVKDWLQQRGIEV